MVNPNLLLVNVDLSGVRPDVRTVDARHPADVAIAGYSDAILRFIADRGEGVGLVTYVNNIDLAYSLTAPASSPTAITTSTSSASTSSSSALAKKNAHHHRPTPHAAPTGRVEPPAARAVRGPAVSLAGRMWRCARVFISSTFRFAGQGVREGARAYHLFMMYIYIDFVVS